MQEFSRRTPFQNVLRQGSPGCGLQIKTARALKKPTNRARYPRCLHLPLAESCRYVCMCHSSPAPMQATSRPESVPDGNCSSPTTTQKSHAAQRYTMHRPVSCPSRLVTSRQEPKHRRCFWFVPSQSFALVAIVHHIYWASICFIRIHAPVGKLEAYLTITVINWEIRVGVTQIGLRKSLLG